ncbi:hypothetical protein NNC19_02610 [Clostridium sp. SHJSY1]|uniref:hypothetical protein n=1 Tax=Clostridium sp. SHJSY1 TaxID=2942483 RepID=UPI00287713FF|nr:hypothetical protein [Clostridium sp. SHJSY1]MDS0524553.1 hypothetical protein [Clostridium sp. SHJSY1]
MANKNNKDTTVVNKDINQLSVELGWISRELVSSYFAFIGTFLTVTLRTSRYISKLDEINNTNYADSMVLAFGMVPSEIIKTFPRIIDELFLSLAINSTEISFESLVNANNISDISQDEIDNIKKGLIGSYLAYIATKIGYDIDVASLVF